MSGPATCLYWSPDLGEAARGREQTGRRRTPATTPLPPKDGGAEAQTAVTQVARPAQKRPPAPQPNRPAAAQKTTRRLALAALAVAAIAAAAIGGMMLGTSKPSAVHDDTVQSQIDGMRGFVEANR